ncbi:MAG: MmcQ/YjbR family DNA-binding protein [Janthinobacterium lividum]
MNIEDFRDFCLSLPGASEDLPFGPDTLVFKVGSKLFALTNLQTFESYNVKCDPERAVELREQYDYVLPGFHMNKKHWNTIVVDAGATMAQQREWITHSYQLVVASLPKALRAELAEATKEL